MRADDRDENTKTADSLRLRLGFLGPEFLTWVYFHLEQVGGELLMNEIVEDWPNQNQSFQIGVGKQMTLKSFTQQEGKMSIVASTLEERAEVMQSIKEGALIDSMSFEMTIESRVHNFVIHSQDGAIAQLKTVQDFEEEKSNIMSENDDVSEEVSFEAQLILRMSSLDEVEAVIDGLFFKFLKKRLAQEFMRQELGAIRRTIAEVLESKLPKVGAKDKLQPVTIEEARL